MVELKGFLWKKLHRPKLEEEEKKEEKPREKPKEEAKKETKKEAKKEEKRKEEKKEAKPVEEPKSEEELRKMDQLLRERDVEIRKQEEMIKEKKLKIFRHYDALNIEKLKSMGLNLQGNGIRCIKCREWKNCDRKKLLKLIDKNGFDVIWKYTCYECRKKLKRKKVSEKYSVELIDGSE